MSKVMDLCAFSLIDENELLSLTGHTKSRMSFRGIKRALTPSNLFNSLRKTSETCESEDPGNSVVRRSFSEAMFSHISPSGR